jgi:hypothetical protein
VRRYRAEAATYCTRVCDRTEVLCAVSRLVVVRPVGAAPVRRVYSRPEVSPRADYILYNCWLQHVCGGAQARPRLVHRQCPALPGALTY